MQGRPTGILLLVLLVLSTQGLLWGQDKKPTWLKDGGNKPIEITSDRLDAYREKDLVEFSGNVVATQGERVIKSDSLKLYFRKREGVQGAAVGAAKAGDIERIVSAGNVRITEKERIVTGEQAIFYNDEQKIVITGNPVMQEGQNVITGDRVIVLLNENRGIVEGAAGKRVEAIIHPDEPKEKKKKD